MNTGRDKHPSDANASDFDTALRQVHVQALEHVPTRTLRQLRPQQAPSRDATAKPHLFAWPLAATCAIALVAGGLFLRLPTQPLPVDTAPSVAANEGEPGDVYAALDESPELYLWLASNDTENLVME